MKLLAIDTATEACSAALSIDGQLWDDYRIAPQQHSELILSMVEELLRQANLTLSALDAIAFGRGPGSFVGVRIAAGVTQGLAYAARLPVIPVSSLAAMAQGCRAGDNRVDDRYLVAIDARMQEVYWAEYQRGADGVVDLVGRETVQAPDRVSCALQNDHACYHGIGSGWGTYRTELTRRCKVQSVNSEVFPRAVDILQLAQRDFQAGRLQSAFEAQPVYLRNQVVKRREKDS